MDKKCYQSYYGMWIEPAGGGKIMVSTCCNNTYLRTNRLIVRENIKDTWNALPFRRQREQIAKGDWSFCRGARCSSTPRQITERIFKNPLVGQSIAQGAACLAYPPQEVFIIPSFACNNDCFCCYCKQKVRCGKRDSYALSSRQIEEIVRDIIPSASSIVLSGGEPFYGTVGNDLLEKTLSCAPEAQVNVFTNGTLLHRFGLARIISHSIGLRISFYGMSERVYKNVTGTNGFIPMMDNVESLLKQGYGNMRFFYLLSDRSHKDARRFCSFVAAQKGVEGVVRNNVFDGNRYRPLMLSLSREFAGKCPRLSFEYRSETTGYKIFRSVMNHIPMLRSTLRNAGCPEEVRS